MEKTIIKAVSIAAIVLFGLSFAACGKKNLVEDEGPQYVYVTSYKEIKPTLGENEYITSESLSKDSLLFSVNSMDENYNFKGVSIHAVNLETNEETVTNVNDSRYGNTAWLNKVSFLEDGGFYALVQEYDEATMNNGYLLVKYTKEGDIEAETDLNFLASSDAYFYIQDMYTDAEENVILSSQNDIVKLSKKGDVLGKVSVNSYISGITVTKDGTVYAAFWDDAEGKNCLKPINASFNGFDEATGITANNARLYSGNEGKILVSTDTKVFMYDSKTKTSEECFDWLDMDVDSNYLVFIGTNDDGTYSIITSTYDENGQRFEYANVKKEIATSENSKEIIRLGCSYLDYNVKQEIRKYNKENQKYRIKVKQYSEEYDDYETAQDMMGTDLTQGKIDIILLDAYTKAKYEKAGALLDLNSLIDKDSDINREDYFGNIFKACESDGKLYALPHTVSVQTMAVPTKYANGKTSWTLDDYIAYRNEHLDIPFAMGMTKETALYMFVCNSIGEFVDTKSGECNFTRDEFYKSLEFCNTFPSEYGDEDRDDWGEIKNGNTILMTLYLSDLDELQLYGNLAESGISLIGYPTSDGSGSLAYFYNILGISSKAKNQEAAWDFLKRFLKYDYQISNSYNGFPVLKKAFDDAMEQKMQKQTYMDENGNVVEAPISTWGNGHTTIEIYAASKEEVDLVKKTLEGVTKTAYQDEQISSIISEETGAFFEGQKSAEEVANIIQSRVKIYLAENK